ncbi:MAG TPA: hypothetical protein VGU20_31225 [Stellaceae bacterium]|nr:hypothetical protein [Terriglobia bacterium]HEV2551824.1 hypothetical protein [Stellaceae bacterium]
MTHKAWTASEIRALARQTVDGRKQIATARGAYLRALIETAQAELAGKSDQEAQLTAIKHVHRQFYPVVQEATTTPDIAHSDRLPRAERRRRALERNRRANFARSAYGTIRRWLRAEGHDLMKLNAPTVTKSQLLNEAPPTRKHALTPERVHARARKLTGALLGFTRQLAKIDQAQATSIANEAIEALVKFLASPAKATTDAQVAVSEQRPLRMGQKVFWLTPTALRKTA